MTRPRTKLQKAPPMGGALRASGPEGAEHGSVALMLSQDQTHKCGCRCCTDVVDVGHWNIVSGPNSHPCPTRAV